MEPVSYTHLMIMAIVITWQMKYADIEPEVNRNRSLYISKMHLQGKAVSYTHLDVYKRQVLLPLLHLLPRGVLRRFLVTELRDQRFRLVYMFVQLGVRLQLVHVPVSYTHLDVYKRQVPGTLPEKPRPYRTCLRVSFHLHGTAPYRPAHRQSR